MLVQDIKMIFATYNHFVEVFYDYLRLNNDLRDIDFKKI